MRSLSRRQFLYVSAGISGSVALAAVGSFCGDDGLHAVSRKSWALGGEVTMTALHRDTGLAATALDAAFAELEQVEKLMSIYRPQGQLSRLNREGVLHRPHPYFVKVLRHARGMSEETDGAFDVTVQPLWSVYRQASQRGELPSESELDLARARVNWRHVEITPDRLRLRRGAQITLNGIAQGFAADCAVRALQSYGVDHALIDTGELGGLGRKENGEEWTVGIQHPRREDAYISLAKLNGRFLATSGDYETTFSGDFRHHHLLDPRTGRSPEELASVTIAARTGMEADALSTAVFVLGPERGAELVRRTPGADVFLVLKDGTTLATGGFPLAPA